MRFAIVSCHLPEPEGNSPGRALLALGDGLVQAGYRVEVWSWRPQPPSPDAPRPAWCRWEPLPPEAAWRTRLRALARPRADVIRAGWDPPAGAVAIADELTSVDAVLPAPASAVTFHYRTRSTWPPSASAPRRGTTRPWPSPGPGRRRARTPSLHWRRERHRRDSRP